MHLTASPVGAVAAAGLHARGSGVPEGLQGEGGVTGHAACGHLHHSTQAPALVCSPSLKGQTLVLTESGSKGHTWKRNRALLIHSTQLTLQEYVPGPLLGTGDAFIQLIFHQHLPSLFPFVKP